MSKYYIITSVGKLTFRSCDLSKLVIHVDEITDKVTKVESISEYEELLSRLCKLYSVTKLDCELTDNWWFLKLHLVDSNYGKPEYKVYRNFRVE